MIILTRLKITSPILGELRKDQRGIRCLKKRSGDIAVDRRHWNEQFRAAVGILQSYADMDTVLLPDRYVSPTLHIYRRRFSGTQIELFESIRSGTVLTIEFKTREDLKNCPTLDEFEKLLVVVGESLGLSQWGSKFDFGRFRVISCTKKNNDTANRLVIGQPDDNQSTPGTGEVPALPAPQPGVGGLEAGIPDGVGTALPGDSTAGAADHPDLSGVCGPNDEARAQAGRTV